MRINIFERFGVLYGVSKLLFFFGFSMTTHLEYINAWPQMVHRKYVQLKNGVIVTYPTSIT